MKKQLRDLEAKENWIAARIDELMDDDDFFKEWCAEHDFETIEAFATRTAEREHASLMADLEEAMIDSMELK